MTAINRLPSKATPIDNDLIVIWDSQSGRTRNTTFSGAGSLLFGQVNPVTDIDYSEPNLIIDYYNGTTKTLKIKEAASNGFSFGVLEQIRVFNTTATTTTVGLVNYGLSAESPWFNVNQDNLFVYIDGVKQEIVTDYTVTIEATPTLSNPSLITFTSPVAINTEILVVNPESGRAINIYESVSYAISVLSGLDIGKVIAVSDYYGGVTPNGSGILYFKIVAPATGVPDGGKFIDGTGFQLEQVIDAPYNAKGFGAVGDGVVDDSASIQAALNHGVAVYLPSGTFKAKDLFFTKDNQEIFGCDSDIEESGTVLFSDNGVILTNNNASVYMLGNIISKICFKGGWINVDRDDWNLSSGTTKTLTSTNNGVVITLGSSPTIENCSFKNLHDGLTMNGTVASNVINNRAKDNQRCFVFDNGTAGGDPASKNTSTLFMKNRTAYSYFGIWCRDVVDNWTVFSNTFEWSNTGAFLFNCNGIRLETYFETLYEGIYVDGGFTGTIDVSDNTFFGGVQGSFWGDGPAITIGAAGSDTRIRLGHLRGLDGRLWIGYDGITAADVGKKIVYDGFMGQPHTVEAGTEDLSVSSAVVHTVYYNSGDRFEVEVITTEVDTQTTTVPGYFKAVIDPSTESLISLKDVDAVAGASVNQGFEIFFGGTFFQITNKAAMSFSQSSTWSVVRVDGNSS